MSKRVLFIDRDGTIIREAPPTYQIDSFSKVRFFTNVFLALRKIAAELNYELVMVTNQDGMGTDVFPEDSFWPVHNFIMQCLADEQIHFDAVYMDKSFPHEGLATRKPGTGMLTAYLNADAYDMANSFVIGDRITDVQLAANLGCKAIWLNEDATLGLSDTAMDVEALRADIVALETTDWLQIYSFLKLGLRKQSHQRYTNETKIDLSLNLDGTGKADINTGLHFFNHMLDQLARHGQMDITLKVQGDLHVDEHHTIEDTAIALGECMALALADKRGLERYGFVLPMDDAEASVSIDFGGRSWLVWDAQFSREKIGDMPTEMFYHFFKSFSDACKCNLNIRVTGTNEHHKIESIFKAFAKAVRMAVKRNPDKLILPSTKGVL